MKISTPYSFYSCGAHDDVLAQWARVQNEEGPLELDLSRASFIDPYGIVALVLFLNHLPPEAKPVKLCLDGWHPGQKGACPDGVPSYLTRMGFWDEVREPLGLSEAEIPPRNAWSSDKNVLIDVTILHGRDAVGVMLRKSGEILSSLGFTPVARGHVMEVLSEVSSNVLDHAQAEFGGVVTTQTYRSRRSGTRYLVMSIGDAGVGVRHSLKGNEKLARRLDSDSQALGVAVQLGCSRFANGGRGGGLPRVVDIARRYGGSVAIRSGAGALTFQGSNSKREEQKQVFDAPRQTGTQLRIMLPENRLRGENGSEN